MTLTIPESPHGHTPPGRWEALWRLPHTRGPVGSVQGGGTSTPIGFVPPCRKGGVGPMCLWYGARGQPGLTVPRPAHAVWAMMGRWLLEGPPRVRGPNTAGLTWPDT